MKAQPFPSLQITADELVPEGSFAEAQATYLRPDPGVVERLTRALRAQNAGVVAHFYMDPELQGVLAASEWPHVYVSDSLAMADRAVQMVEQGAKTIIVLGVDFMSENVRAVLDAAGHPEVPVYRVASDAIGCSLAESAEAREYGMYLTEASHTPRSLHVVYINTSLLTKAKAHALVPTITCTSSNVVKTVLTATAQVPGLHVWFGPDTYMGQNLQHLFEALAEMDDETIRALHPDHDAASVRALLERFHYFQQGICIVHHMFGGEVVERVRESYPDAFVAAHLEVPGEMFALGLEGQQRDAGVVGSTSNILAFILRKVDQAIEAGRASPDAASAADTEPAEPKTLQFILGTEAGMITPIVRQVQEKLRKNRDAGGPDVRAEVVFPVASEAIAEAPGTELSVLPGVAAGEGCSTAGGCATCPYMKMNNLAALFDLLEQHIPAAAREGGRAAALLRGFEPRKYTQKVHGRTAADLGVEPIEHMRAFQQTGRLPDALVDDIIDRETAA
ncbi:MAG: quinolinate synthase NadA [Myxococcales bacterium]|nr:quinolinate synthase NadA [Myxococcales bacterium]